MIRNFFLNLTLGQIIIAALASVVIFQFVQIHYKNTQINQLNSKLTSITEAKLEQDKVIIQANQLAIKQSQDYKSELANLKTKQEVVYRNVEKVIEKPVYRNVCLDTDGLQLINQATRNHYSHKNSN